jgi:hypothetical protein
MLNQEQIQNLKDRQNCNLLHPYTCCSHNNCSITDNRLIPNEYKWYCPCGEYTQEYRGEQNNTDWKIIQESFKEHPFFKFQTNK